MRKQGLQGNRGPQDEVSAGAAGERVKSMRIKEMFHAKCMAVYFLRYSTDYSS